jgi:ABC-type sugar transport system ATPase subunit
LFRGVPVVFHHPTEARAHGIATIYQEFSLVPSLSWPRISSWAI